jgi:hypothetical protein
MVYGPNNNAVLVNDCNPLENLKVTLLVTADLITKGNNGFSLQLNCYPQANSKHAGAPLKWAQYVIAVYSDSIRAGIQHFSLSIGSGFSPKDNYVPFAQLSAGTGPPNSVPQGTVMEIALATDPKEGKVTHATFRITFPGTGTLHYSFKFPASALCAISGFQVNLVGPPIGTHTCTFIKSGAGNLTYAVSSGTLAVAPGKPPACFNPDLPPDLPLSDRQPITGEKSNATYSAVSPLSGPTVGQNLFT